MSSANYQTAADVFAVWRENVLIGEPPMIYPVGNGELEQFEIGPKIITLVGGAPGAGKTAFTMQCVVDALRLDTSLRVLVCNVEMPSDVLLDRQLARLSGIDAATIRFRKLGHSHAERIDRAMNTLEGISERLCFVRPPFDLKNLVDAADAFEANLLVLDYIQRIPPPGEHSDRRGSVDATMSHLRRFADSGRAIIVVAAVARQKDNRGRSSYAGDSLSLASFRESSELEFGADNAFILSPDPKSDGTVLLRHLKARHTEPRDVTLIFERKLQRFTPESIITEANPDGEFHSYFEALEDLPRTESGGKDE